MSFLFSNLLSTLTLTNLIYLNIIELYVYGNSLASFYKSYISY